MADLKAYAMGYIRRNPPPAGLIRSKDSNEASVEQIKKYKKDGMLDWWLTIDGVELQFRHAIHLAQLTAGNQYDETVEIDSESIFHQFLQAARDKDERTPYKVAEFALVNYNLSPNRGFPKSPGVLPEQVEIYTGFVGAQPELHKKEVGHLPGPCA